ncbi:VOC family protein [Undibacter mobilis]|uniref:VOC family protein n=1 Tax=Undibacter mobilis TaxID=2292256 RepID=A0A371B3B5_9BRAD|nr:VOC family protein [Undibacter mobilis]RDV01951.1 VOC family protein [Undibacter mobilis]
MIDHVSIAVRDLAAATRFYEAVLGAIGMKAIDVRAATVGFGKQYSEFWINLRRDMAPVEAGSGAHICFRARSTEMVDAFHAAALAAGGVSDGAPGLRPHDGEGGYYAAFIRDPDGNRIEAVTFTK